MKSVVYVLRSTSPLFAVLFFMVSLASATHFSGIAQADERQGRVEKILMETCLVYDQFDDSALKVQCREQFIDLLSGTTNYNFEMAKREKFFVVVYDSNNNILDKSTQLAKTQLPLNVVKDERTYLVDPSRTLSNHPDFNEIQFSRAKESIISQINTIITNTGFPDCADR